MDDYQFSPIGYVESCFKQKFAIPRQPGLAPHATAIIKLGEQFTPETVQGLELSSHIWVQFVFHETMEEGWSPRVRPPRLGGNKKMGVFATRSTHRPNPIGMSVVKLDDISFDAGVSLSISGIDLLDGTPVLDIKPYLPYVDSVRTANNELALSAPVLLPVTFTDTAMGQIRLMQQGRNTDLLSLIREILAQDPRPAYQKIDQTRTYGVALLDFDLKWRYCVKGEEISVEVQELLSRAH